MGSVKRRTEMKTAMTLETMAEYVKKLEAHVAELQEKIETLAAQVRAFRGRNY